MPLMIAQVSVFTLATVVHGEDEGDDDPGVVVVVAGEIDEFGL